MFGKGKKKQPKPVKLCTDYTHDWFEVGKCKDFVGNHPCEYHPEGCATCMTRFECYTKDTDTYRSRFTGIFYACRKCPAVKVEGEIYSWDNHNWENVLDIRESSWKGMDKDTVKKLQEKWEVNGDSSTEK